MSGEYNYVAGNQINQKGGNHNVIKIGKVSSRATQTLSVADRTRAIGELAAFIDYLERHGVVSSSGQIADAGALESAVIARRSKLRKVSKAIASGASEALSNAFGHVAVPVILSLIGRLGS